ncbi:MAG: type II toxin-antitoxin system HipA family toxin YjjJ [Arenimonas sp.]
MDASRTPQLEAFLRQGGTHTSADIRRAIGGSQPTVSRALAALGDRIVRVGRGRAIRYGLARDIARAGHRWPLYRIDAEGRAAHLGDLGALQGQGFYFASPRSLPAFAHAEFVSGLFPGLPWFLDDQRPQGFLGRAFARRIAAEIGAPAQLHRWQADDVLLGMLLHGHDLVGDLVLGESALQRALQRVISPHGMLSLAERQDRYPEKANAALAGENVGSSAAGEQPKFLAMLRGDEGVREVIVKFSEGGDSPAGQRWRDLLHCEGIAANVLPAHGQPSARTEVLEADGRVFLESTRFDRTPKGGRSGFVSLAALDSAFHGHGRIDWWRYATQLQRENWIDADSARRLRVLGWFGDLIGNSDMHLGNAGLELADNRPLALVPTYDMLPMMFRPASTGEVVEREFAITLPTPDKRGDWSTAATAAMDFWQRVSASGLVSATFKSIARKAGEKVSRALQQFGE